MEEETPERMRQRIAEIQRRMAAIGPVMRGSVTFMGRRHRQPYFSASVGGRTRVVYLGAERTAAARRCVANYRELAAMVDELTLLRMQLLKIDPTAEL